MASETEKITLNISPVDLGRIDLLVEERFYSNRSDFIRTAIRHQIDHHTDQVHQAASRRSMVLGVLSYSQRELAQKLERGEALEIFVVGLLHLADDITPELALSTICSIKVYGSFDAPADVRAALAEAGRIL
jgi:metal-responsive CopG/Arc/MetJ family transcriptional regulator